MKPPSTLFTARILMPDAATVVDGGALLVREGRILAVGLARELRTDHADATLVDFGDAVLLPPLVNAHTHLELTHFSRWSEAAGETGPPDDFVDWILRLVRVKRTVSAEDYVSSLAEGLRSSLSAGTGAVGDILSVFSARSGYRGTPLRGRFFLEALGRDPVANRSRLEAIGDILDEGPLGWLQPGIAPHSPYTLDDEYLAETFACARRRDLAASIHFAESPAETALLRNGDGPLATRLFPAVGWEHLVPKGGHRSSITCLKACGALGPRTLLVHGVQVDDSDIEAIARCGATVVLCPRSNANLDVGVAPVDRYRAAGVPLALGTDSLASCDSLSIWDEVAFARRWFGGLLDPPELLAMATRQGARALGLEGEMDALAPGRGAQFQVLRPTAFPAAGEVHEYLVAPGRSREVAALYLDGRDVLHNR